MPEKPIPAPLEPGEEPNSGSVAHIDRKLWRQLANAGTTEELAGAWLAIQAGMITGVTAGLVLLERDEAGTIAPVALWPEASGEPQKLRKIVERALRERKSVVARGSDNPDADSSAEADLQVAYPIIAGGRVRGVCALQLTPRPQHEIQSVLRNVQWGAAWLQAWVLAQSGESAPSMPGKSDIALELTARALEEERFQGAAGGFVTELSTRLNCDRVSVGFVERGHVKVRALSHSAEFGKRMNLIRSIAVAMGESVDQQAVLVYPEPDDGSHRVLQAHEQLARTHGDRAVCTVPFVGHDGRAFGALTLERSAPEPFDRQTVEMCDGVGALVGHVLDEKRRNDRWLLAKLGSGIWEHVRKLIGPRYVVRKIVTAAVLALVLFFSFATGMHRITAKTVLEGEVQRVVVAPYRGFVFEAPVRAGDIVREGQTMCALDTRDLLLEHAKWTSEREQFVLEHRIHMAEGDVASMRVVSKKMNQTEARLALLDEQISRATMVAPFDGVVVSGDLTQSLGAPVEEGEVLFEVAPLGDYRVTLQVDERDIDRVEVAQRGELILTALPDTRLGFSVAKITPVSLAEEGRNFFEVEARLDDPSARLRPGMEGYGKIEIEQRKLIWVWTHEMIDWFRLWLWSWWP